MTGKKLLSLILCSVTMFLLMFNVNAETLYDYMLEARANTKSDELTDISTLLYDSGCGDSLTGEVNTDNMITAYFIDTGAITEENNNDGELKNLITDEYFYRYFDPNEGSVTEVIKRRDTGEWIINSGSLELKGYEEKFPHLSYLPEDITANILERYPTVDFDSVKFLYLIEVSHTLVYFTADNTDYVAYYPLVDIDNGLSAGEIYTADVILDTLADYPIFNPITDGDEENVIRGGASVSDESFSMPWFVYPVIAVVIALIAFVIYKATKRKAKA